MVDDLNHGNVRNVANALLALVVVDEDYVVHFVGSRANQTRSIHFEEIKRVLRFAIYFSQAHRFDVLSQFCFQVGISDRRTDRIRIRIFVSED
ncbi:hypothetical protein D1872_287590 [compost metagenome]